jgi:hypothetical protein
MAINKQRPGWALGLLIFNIVLFVWSLTIEDGGFSHLMMIPELMRLPGYTGMQIASVVYMVVWNEVLGTLFEIFIMYKIFINVKTSKIKNEQNI